MKTRVDYLLDFDGTVTGATGEEAFGMMSQIEIFDATSKTENLKGDCTLKSVDDLVKVIEDCANPQSYYHYAWGSDGGKFLVTKESLEFLDKITSKIDDSSSTNIMFISRNHKNYILAMLKYSLKIHFKDKPMDEIEKIMKRFEEKITIYDRKSLPENNSKAHGVLNYLNDKKDLSSEHKIYMVDDSADIKDMVAGATRFKEEQDPKIQSQIEIKGIFKNDAKKTFPGNQLKIWMSLRFIIL